MAARITLPIKTVFFGFFLGVSPCLDKLIHQPGPGFFQSHNDSSMTVGFSVISPWLRENIQREKDNSWI